MNVCSDSDHTVTGWRTVLAVVLAECGAIEITGVSLSDTLTASKARRLAGIDLQRQATHRRDPRACARRALAANRVRHDPALSIRGARFIVAVIPTLRLPARSIIRSTSLISESYQATTPLGSLDGHCRRALFVVLLRDLLAEDFQVARVRSRHSASICNLSHTPRYLGFILQSSVELRKPHYVLRRTMCFEWLYVVRKPLNVWL